MTVYEILQELSDLEPDMEVRIMSQPSWPFEYSISGTWEPEVVYPNDNPYPTPEDVEHVFQPTDPPESGVVYLIEGRQIGYGTKDAWGG